MHFWRTVPFHADRVFGLADKKEENIPHSCEKSLLAGVKRLTNPVGSKNTSPRTAEAEETALAGCCLCVHVCIFACVCVCIRARLCVQERKRRRRSQVASYLTATSDSKVPPRTSMNQQSKPC